MERRNNDPGAVQYGNFMNYYQFKLASEVIKVLPASNIWLPQKKEEEQTDTETTNEPYLVLDVGCNCGTFTLMLHSFLETQLLRPVHILGVDIDKRLIERAQLENTCPAKIHYFCGDVLDGDSVDETIATYLQQHQRSKFDAICCFSITMWIHLNHHDSGLTLFLRKLSALAVLFVVEPQPWKCYQAAQRRLRKTGEEFPLFLKLKWRSNVEQQIHSYLERQIGRQCIYKSTPTKWQRRICFYR